MPFVSSHRYDALPSSEDQPRVGSLDSIRNTESDASIHQGLAEDEAAHIASEEPEIVLDATSSPNTHSVDAAHTSTDIIHRSSLVSVAESDQACSTALEEPSHNDSDRELQKLTIGWKTSALLVGFYLTALLVAILHFVMMHSLNGKPIDDQRYLGQQYVTSFSLLLVAIFKACLCGSLAIAFTQHMWKILKTEAIRVSSIESLHGVRHNPLLLAEWRVLRAAPVLYLMAALMWLIAIIILFPPSALTIIPHRFEKQQPTLVPTFSASYGQDYHQLGSGLILGNSSLSFWLTTMNKTSGFMSYQNPSAKLARLANVVLISGAVPESRPPCGVNCSYVIEVAGPKFKCNTTLQNQTFEIEKISNAVPHFNSGWGPTNTKHFTSTTFNMNLTKVVGYCPTIAENEASRPWTTGGISENWGNQETLVLQESQFLQCEPARAKYKISFEYANGLRTLFHHVTTGVTLQDTFMHEVDNDLITNTSVVWNQNRIRTLESLNHYAILDTVVMRLAGTYNQLVAARDAPNFSYKLSNGTTLNCSPLKASFVYSGKDLITTFIPDVSGFEIQPNKTWIGDTVFNENRYSSTKMEPSFMISEELLNEVVANVTIAAMLSYYPPSVWNATVVANVTTYRNIYSFSRPLNLILPYTLSLTLTLPFLILGYLSLRRNRVAALSDSFLQLLVTITRSEELDRVARPCAPGGDETATQELKDMHIMFGELATESGAARRLGFGLEEEVVRVAN